MVAARTALFSAVRSAPTRFAAAFRALDVGAHRGIAFQVAESLGAEATKAGSGPRRREALRVDGVVVVRKASAFTIHIFDTSEAARTFVAELPPIAEPAQKKQKPRLAAAPGFVAIWIDTVLDPRGTLDGAGGPVGFFDQDHWESGDGPLEQILPRLSHAASFATAALARARELGALGGTRVDALFGSCFPAKPGPNTTGRGWYLGAFPFRTSAGT
jgi:hypothetical protein